MHALRAGGGGLKIHEDVSAGPEQIRSALDLADATTCSSRSTPTGSTRRCRSRTRSTAFGGRTIHAFHIEGCGGGHAPDLLALAAATAC